MSIHDRLTELFAETGRRQADLARYCGVSTAAVSGWCTGAIRNIKVPNLFAAADFFGVQPRWLALGEGDKRQPPGAPINEPQWIEAWLAGAFAVGTFFALAWTNDQISSH